MRDKYEDARKRLSAQGYVKKPNDLDVNALNYSENERADILLPGGFREVWIKSKRPVGRPKTITDMKAYKASKAREYRAKAKRLEALK